MDWESRKREALQSDEYQIILQRINEKRSRKMRRTHRPRNLRTQWNCSVCGVRFRSIEGVLDTGKVATCIKCGGKACKEKCSSQDHRARWVCQTCQHPESWFKGILKALHPNSVGVNAFKIKMDPNRIDEIDEDLEAVKKKEREEVREFIEKLVEAMLGDNIDNTSITRIYNDEKYLPIIGQSPCSAHASLKLLIQRIIQEAIGLPALNKAQEHPATPPESINRTYEDLLATAILNKVIQNYQDELPTSSANSVSSRISSSSRQKDKEYFFGEETLNKKWKNGVGNVPDADTTSVSSLEEWVRSDSSIGSTKYLDHMSLTIQQRIEEVSSSEDDAEPETPTRNTLPPDNEEWQENWLMQKRKFGGTASPIPVPMLVPNPTTEAKVLIGDREAEDTTDLSDAGSDFGDAEPPQAIENILVESKTVIGGKNLLVDTSMDDQNVSEDGSTDVSDMIEEREQILEQLSSSGPESDKNLLEAAAADVATEDGMITANKLVSEIEDHSLTSLEQDTEYTEKYATLPRTILKSPAPAFKNYQNGTLPQDNGDEVETKENGIKDEVGVNGNGIKEEVVPKQNGHHNPELTLNDHELEEKFKGSYSEREKQKWKNAIEMKNNPYSPENLNRRLSGRSSNGNYATLYGRDYYIREATKSAGARKKLASTDDSSVEPQATSPTESPTVFKAMPAVIDSPLNTDTESSVEVSSPIQSMSDSDLSIERIYNLPSGKVYEKIGDTNREIMNGSKSPQGITYRTIDTELIDVDNDNRNSVTSDRKREFLRSLTASEEEISQNTPVNDVFNYDNSMNSNNVPLLDDTLVAEKSSSALNDQDDELEEATMEFSLEYSTDEIDHSITSPEISLNPNSDPEIVDLKDKHLVRNLLGQFSKSYPNVATISLKKPDVNKEQISQQLSAMKTLDRSVEDLRKRFSNEDNTHMKPQVYSLTARSIPREFREELKKENGTANETPAVTCDDNEEETKSFPNAKSRIQFFESLKR